ncbi:hypothetical protein MKJ01_07280 [Chryseobacterium sp. SSA4.19]|uniref:hypothetical protein n=1 Tax=Chryseobacterium sp. SSA4.19 TaxID=2919915 RepID=UPI001F4D86E3|nr:hypothetical protein [Chryseobacterium sp. SSA4.19]MCJ8153565.1 hypothetical protein [Chryseobacterium sp. SSA4.19]
MKNFGTVLLLVFLLISCNKEEPFSKNTEYSFEDILDHTDTLSINSRFDECGEWGGHKEYIKIYSSDKKEILKYTKYKVNCGNTNHVGQIIQTKDFSKTIVLSKAQNKAVMYYMNNLLQLKFITQSFGNSGNSFSIKRSDGSLHISHYGSSRLLLNNYNALMNALDFDSIKINN